MTTIRLELSDDLANFLHQAVRAGNFADPAAYIEALLIRAKNIHSEVTAVAIDGIASGDCLTWDDALKVRLRQEVAHRLLRPSQVTD